MRKAIALYKQLYEVPEEVSDTWVAYEILSFLVFFFSLGFCVSQLIIFILR